MLIFASISFLLLPTLTIQQGHLLMQIKYALTYHLGGISLICQLFYKLWKSQAFHGRRFYVQKWVLFRKFLYS
ncbi:hypothetical protein CWI88_20880 [Enterobacter cancerogenus]|nr:hypothetical protein CWI88_20880 [Enterobacter cancerogenus]